MRKSRWAVPWMGKSLLSLEPTPMFRLRMSRFSGGTAYLTDAGMCGPAESVLGREIASVVWRLRTGMPTRFPVAKGPVRICGVIVGVDEQSGKAMEVKRVDEIQSGTDKAPEIGEIVEKTGPHRKS